MRKTNKKIRRNMTVKGGDNTANKDCMVTLRCTEEQREVLDAKVKACGMNRSTYIISLILGHHPKKKLSEDDLQLLRDVRKIKADLIHINNFFSHDQAYMAGMFVTNIVKKLSELLYDSNRNID